MRLLALDLFCGEGGVCEGLQRVGFEVVGVDNNPKCGRVLSRPFHSWGCAQSASQLAGL